jgi:hypothetical protein
VEKCVDFCTGTAPASPLELSGVLWSIDAKAYRGWVAARLRFAPRKPRRAIEQLNSFLGSGFLDYQKLFTADNAFLLTAQN